MSTEIENLSNVYEKITLYKNFPKDGIYFRHIGPLLADSNAFKYAIEHMSSLIDMTEVDVVAGLEARGFIFASAFSVMFNKPMVMIRKPSKLPGHKFVTSYSKEYETKNSMELEDGVLQSGQRVLLLDDLLATGGTLLAGADLIRQAGAIPFAFISLIGLEGLNGSQNIKDIWPDAMVKTLLDYPVSGDTLIPTINESISRCFHRSDTFNKDRNNTMMTMKFAQIEKVLENENSKKVLENSKKELELFEYKPIKHFIQDDKRPILMSHPTMATTARRILDCSSFRESNIDWSYFPDGWPNITFEPSSTLIGRDVTFIMNMSKKEIFAEQLSLLIALPRQLINSLTILVPYLGPATHERSDYSGQLATVEPILKILSSCIPQTRSGPPILRIFDIHALQIRFYVTDQITMKLMTAIHILKKYLNLYYDQKPTIVFPDDGAHKRFKYLFEDYPMVICAKVRNGNERSIVIKDMYNWPENLEQIENCHDNCVIVDDLVQSGSTLISCAEALKIKGFKNVSAYVTHAIFPNDSWTRFTENNILDKFIIMNTNPEVTDKLTMKPFHILEIEEYLISELNHQIPDVILQKNSSSNVYVTSDNIDKLSAVRYCYPYERIYGIRNVQSNVPNQPINYEQTRQGSLNRLNSVVKFLNKESSVNIAPQRHASDKDTIISIENGLSCIQSTLDSNSITTLDIPIISIWNNSSFVVYEGDEVIITDSYKKYVDESIKDQTKTFGSLIEKAMGFSKGKWFENIDSQKRSRFDILKNSILKIQKFRALGITNVKV